MQFDCTYQSIEELRCILERERGQPVAHHQAWLLARDLYQIYAVLLETRRC